MGDVSSLYPQPPQPKNALADLPSLIQTMGFANQNARFQQEFAAKKAVGSAFQNALNPDGSVDQTRLAAGLKNPDAAYAAPEAINSLLDQRGKMIANSRAQFDLSAGQSGAILSTLGALADNSNLTIDDVRNTAVTLARNSNIPSQIVNGWLQSLPRDPTALRQTLLNYRNAALGSPGVSGRTEGPVSPEGAPSSISIGQANQGPLPLGPVARTSTGLPVKTDSRGRALDPTTGKPTAAAPTQRLIYTGLPAGVAEAKKEVGAVSGKQYATDLADSSNYRRSVFPLEQAIPALEKLGPQGSGPGTETLNQVKSFVLSLGIPGVDPDKIKNYDEAAKYLTDFVNQNGNTATNDKLAAAFAGNPSVHISNAAAVDVAKSALALRRMRQAQVLEFQKSGLPEDQYSKWSSTWVNGQDPRAYGFDQMLPEPQQKLISSLKGAERAKFIASLKAAHSSQLLNPPQAPGGQ